MKIFWSWQSDTPDRIGKYFVRDALKVAIKRLKSDGELHIPEGAERSALHVDHDRQGVPGTPDIVPTILDKIEKSIVFVADMTTAINVAMTNGSRSREKVINPNVAIEYGYALRALTDRRIILVMNLHYGDRKSLPFDLGMKGSPVEFTLAPGATDDEVSVEQAKLAQKLEFALRLCVAEAAKRQQREDLFVPREAPDGVSALYFQRGEVLAELGMPGEQSAAFKYDHAFYMRIWPKFSSGKHFRRTRLVSLLTARKLVPMRRQTPYAPIWLANDHGVVAFDLEASTYMKALTQVFQSGELWGLCAEPIKPYGTVFQQRSHSGIQYCVGAVAMEHVYASTLPKYVAFMRDELGLDAPYTVELGALGLAGTTIVLGNQEYVAETLPLSREVAPVRRDLRTASSNEIENVLRDYFEHIYDTVVLPREDVISEESITKYSLPKYANHQ